MRRAIIEENRIRRQHNKDESRGFHMVSESAVSSSVDKCQTLSSDDYTNHSNSDNSLNFLEIESYDSDEINTEIARIESYITDNHTTNVCESVFDRVAELELSVLPILRPITDYSNNFTESEGNKLTELFHAIGFLNHRIDKIDGRHVANSYIEAASVLHSSCDNEIRDVVKMSKQFNAFRSVCESDQIVLIKYASLEIIINRMVLKFNFERQYWDIITVCIINIINYIIFDNNFIITNRITIYLI